MAEAFIILNMKEKETVPRNLLAFEESSLQLGVRFLISTKHDTIRTIRHFENSGTVD